MGLFEQFPYTNFHGINLKWILDRMVEFETRLTTAEGKIASLEDRMDRAESDIDALEGAVGDLTQLATTDKSSLVAAINENEGRIDALEDCCEEMQQQIPASEAGDSGKVLTATGAGSASWQAIPKELPATLGAAGQVLTVNSAASGVEWSYPVIYVDYDAENVPDPDVYIPMINRGQMVVLRHTAGNYNYYTGPAWIVKGGSNHTQLWFPDPVGTFSLQVGIVATDPHGFSGLVLAKDGGTPSWQFSGVYNQDYYSSSYT